MRLIIPRRVLTHGGNHKTATVRPSVRPCVRPSVRPESYLRDGWAESNDILHSDGE